MRSHFGLVVTPVDQVDGFVLTKGKQQTLQIAVVRAKAHDPADGAARSGPDVRRSRARSETLVK